MDGRIIYEKIVRGKKIIGDNKWKINRMNNKKIIRFLSVGKG
jgi:hypothetical protein